ncbi:unnamed protein product [Rotaria socialis]|uniref:Uncharacterized protein n=1 Tax=Rotaria socialis TaxID=392032 RepID=A0A820S8Z5_9BILA|nr:unnamed protein product [Rotaria socialis]CAF3318379.1 unnamed protein product [Rotaria socialis]CAF4446670.1 unnamed protein product [Rotaria socialis]CAF4460005.1 unnamed protein product [Rotaria socialis]
MSKVCTKQDGIEVVQLNPVVGCHLLCFLDGLDASNFLEVVNNTNQFYSIAPTSDQIFRQLMQMFCCKQRVLVPRELYEFYSDDFEVMDDRLVVSYGDFDTSLIRPIQRVFVHPCFSIEGFGKLCKVYRTAAFQCYSRLIPFNTDFYCADFCLIDYELYHQTIGVERDLNTYENKFFKISTYFPKKKNQHDEIAVKFVVTQNEFRENLKTRFSSPEWFEAIDFSKFVIVGGAIDEIEFEAAVTITINKLHAIALKHLKYQINVEKVTGSLNYNVSLPCDVTLNFLHKSSENSKKPLSHILHNFDMDICQVAYTGNKIICTFAFMQAMATKSFITYSLHGETSKNVCTRIAKYCRRGFTLLEPIKFDGDFESLMKQDEMPLYRAEHREFIGDDGELQIATMEYWRRPEHNIDTFQLQEAFIADFCPHMQQ